MNCPTAHSGSAAIVIGTLTVVFHLEFALLVTVTFAVYLPTFVGTPVITPPVALTLRPLGSPDALNAAGWHFSGTANRSPAATPTTAFAIVAPPAANAAFTSSVGFAQSAFVRKTATYCPSLPTSATFSVVPNPAFPPSGPSQ